jgi:hypothetical protein
MKIGAQHNLRNARAYPRMPVPGRIRPFLQILTLALSVPLFPAASLAAAAEAEGDATARESQRPTLRAGSLTPDFRLDGRMTERAWGFADDSIANLTTIEPEEGGVPVGETIVKVLADGQAIVIGVACRDPEPSKIVAFSKARDSDLAEEDYVLVVLDPYLDGRSGFVFAVNPAGARFDGLVSARGEEVNSDWDATWEAKAARDETGWGVEIRIPISSLAFKKHQTSWGLNVQRRVQRLQETSRWSGAKLDYEIYQTSQAGLLTGLPDFDLGLGLSVRPAALGEVKKHAPRQTATSDRDLSLDVTQRLGSHLLSALTVNTDFSETEVDVRRINLTRFPISFPEKRTFFLSGADIFEFGLGLDEEILVPFYSRRIGLVGSEEDELAPVPLDVGGKVTGRLGKTSVGALVVNTREVDALRLNNDVPPIRVPDATMGAVRIRQDILAESGIGLLASFGDQRARPGSWSGGLDFTYQTSDFFGEKNLLAGIWGLHCDRKALTGDKYAYGARVEYPNDLLDGNIVLTRIGDGFDPSLGFVPRSGVEIFSTGLEIAPRPGWPMVRQLVHELSFTQFQNRRTDNWESYEYLVKPIDWILESGDRIEVSFQPQGDRLPVTPVLFEVFPDIDIGPGTYEWTRNTFAARSAQKRRITGEARLETGGFYTGSLRTVSGTLALKPSSLFTLELTGERNRGRVWAPADYPASLKLVERRFTQDLVGCRVELNISSDLQITSLTQYDSESRQMGSNTRLRWTFDPNGDIFIVYNHQEIRTRRDPTAVRLVNREWQFDSAQLPIKLQFAWKF